MKRKSLLVTLALTATVLYAIVLVSGTSCFSPYITEPDSQRILYVGPCQTTEPTDEQLTPADRTFVIEYTDCQCDPFMYLGCSHDEITWKMIGTQRQRVHVITNLVGNATLCGTCESNRTIVGSSSEPIICAIEQLNISAEQCVANQIYMSLQQGLIRPCPYVEGSDLEHPEVNPDCRATHIEELIPPPGIKMQHDLHCCQDQDGDGHGIEEYHEDWCGTISNGDCSDQENGTWRGCTRGMWGVRLDLSEDDKKKAAHFKVNDGNFFAYDQTIGKSEKCLQETDWNADGVLPRNSWQCQGQREFGSPPLPWEPPAYPSSEREEQEYPIAGPTFIDGNKVTCYFDATNEPTRWGNLQLGQQKFNVELQKKPNALPSQNWIAHTTQTIDLGDSQCSDGNCCVPWDGQIPAGQSKEEYLKTNQVNHKCQVTFPVTTELRGNQIQCFAYPWNDQITPYWKAKNESSTDGIVADHSTFVFPVDTFIANIMVNVLASNQAIGQTIQLGVQPFQVQKIVDKNDALTSQIHNSFMAYLTSVSEANSKLSSTTHKAVFIENQYNSRRFVLTLDLEVQAVAEHPEIVLQQNPGRPTITVNIPPPAGGEYIASSDARQYYELLEQRTKGFLKQDVGYNIINERDSIILEFNLPPTTLPNDNTLLLTFPISNQNGATINYILDLRGKTISLGSQYATGGDGEGASTLGIPPEGKATYMYIRRDAPIPNILWHEMGHVIQGLCEEYDPIAWASNNILRLTNGGKGCKNAYPLCCMGLGAQVVPPPTTGRGAMLSGTVINSCGTITNCEGTPYYPSERTGNDIPDPLGTRPSSWSWRSQMGLFRGGENQVVYPAAGPAPGVILNGKAGAATGYTVTNLCELRAWPSKPNEERVCQQK